MSSPEALLIDTHCHLDYDYAPKSEADLVNEASREGVSHLITIAAEPDSLSRVPEIAARYPHVFYTLGIHPHEAIHLTEDHLSRIREKALSDPKCRAVGEIGLDYHYDNSPREIQRDALKKQLDLALELKLPVVIHSREAEEDLLEALTDYAGKISDRPAGVIHCFSGTQAFGQACIDLGFYISFSGILTFKKAEDLRQAAKVYPLEKILVETDSPYLAPIPFRGKKCEPSMVVHTARKLAEIKGITFEEAAKATSRNAKLLFGIV